MAKRPTLTDVTSLTNSSAINTLNQNWDNIQSAFDNTLSLDGSTPNAMNADLDINGNALLNVGTIDVENLTLNGQTVTDLATVPEWRSSWLTATSYAVNDLVKTGGNVYICLVAHTSGTFATDLTTLKWELMVSKGDSGAGTGDMVAANNLSDVADVATARANLGLGTVATENTVPVAKGGTGATDATTARTNLSAQTQDAFLDQIAALTDPNADRLLFWDDSAGAIAFGQLGSGLSFSGTTLSADSDLFFRLNSANTGLDSTATQNVFPQSPTLEVSSVYEFDTVFSLTKTAGTTNHFISFGFGGTATLNNLFWYLDSSAFTPGTVAASFTSAGYYTSGTLQNITGNVGTATTMNWWMRVKGTVSINGTGTFIPQYSLSAAPGGAYSTNIGAFYRLRKLGASGGNNTQGTWS